MVSGLAAVPISVGYVLLARGKGAQKLTGAVVVVAMLLSFGFPKVAAMATPDAQPVPGYVRQSYVSSADLQLAVDEVRADFKRMLKDQQNILSNHSDAIKSGNSQHARLVKITHVKLDNISRQFNRQLDDTASNMLRKVSNIAIE